MSCVPGTVCFLKVPSERQGTDTHSAGSSMSVKNIKEKRGPQSFLVAMTEFSPGKEGVSRMGSALAVCG